MMIKSEECKAASQALMWHVRQTVGLLWPRTSNYTGPDTSYLHWYLSTSPQSPPCSICPRVLPQTHWDTKTQHRNAKVRSWNVDDYYLWVIKFGLILIFFLYHLIFPLTKNIYCFYLPKNKINKAIFKNPPLTTGRLVTNAGPQGTENDSHVVGRNDDREKGGFATAHGPQPQLQPLLGPLGTLWAEPQEGGEAKGAGLLLQAT